MARNRKRSPEVDEVAPYLEGVAKNLVDRLYGPKGPPWGTRLTELEDVVLAVREYLSQQMLDQALARQAAEPERPMELRMDPNQRLGLEFATDCHNYCGYRTREPSYHVSCLKCVDIQLLRHPPAARIPQSHGLHHSIPNCHYPN